MGNPIVKETKFSNFKKDTSKKVCKCGPPYGYAPHIPNGTCRFCFGYNQDSEK